MRKLISKWFPVGTKSLLFGVHQFLWHPWTVARAWRHIYGRWPNIDEAICIFVHDWGYWGCANMDGEQGKRHPEAGAAWAFILVFFRHWLCFRSNEVAGEYADLAESLTLFHSSHYANRHREPPSPLYLPDKVSILFEPRWWYLLRARLSGEVYEYVENSPFAGIIKVNRWSITRPWYYWYRGKVKQKLEQHKKLCA